MRGSARIIFIYFSHSFGSMFTAILRSPAFAIPSQVRVEVAKICPIACHAGLRQVPEVNRQRQRPSRSFHPRIPGETVTFGRCPKPMVQRLLPHGETVLSLMGGHAWPLSHLSVSPCGHVSNSGRRTIPTVLMPVQTTAFPLCQFVRVPRFPVIEFETAPLATAYFIQSRVSAFIPHPFRPTCHWGMRCALRRSCGAE